MDTKKWRIRFYMLTIALLFLFDVSAEQTNFPTNGKLKICILSGQSNMVGFGQLKGNPGTMETYVKSKPHDYGHLVDQDGKPIVRDDVWIVDISHPDKENMGWLTTGYGASPDHIGPEYAFGFAVGDYFEDPVLLIKSAWGGKSLYHDFLPPHAADYPTPEKESDMGFYYAEILRHVKEITGNLKKYYPNYANNGYEIIGFGWHQGWNDRINQQAVDNYEKNMVNFVKDIRNDLGIDALPFVIANTGMGGWDIPARYKDKVEKLMNAQLALSDPQLYPEFKGNVAGVETRDFQRTQEESPSKQEYHWMRNWETYYLIGNAMGESMIDLISGKAGKTFSEATIQQGEMAGYLLVPHDKVPATYNAGFSLYAAAWPLVNQYPGNRFQTGLFGTWMFAQYDGLKPEKLYSDIEGGLGWWRDTRFATITPKFIMGGVAPNFIAWANGPGAGKGRDWDEPKGKYGIAQLSPWLLWPPDGLNLKQGMCGELFGYGYLALPLTDAKSITAGKNVPTGNHNWTLFLNTKNFKGPVAFFTPYFWSKAYVDNPDIAGMLLDTRPAEPNRHLQMETQYVPSVQATDGKGETYARIAPTSFPHGSKGESVVVHRITAYNKDALWNAVEAWFEDGTPASSVIPPHAQTIHTIPGNGGATWRIYTPQDPKEKRARLAWHSFATPTAIDEYTFGYRWNEQWVTQSNTNEGSLVTLPEYYRLGSDENNNPQWVAVQPNDVPEETGLTKYRFENPREEQPEPYLTPDNPEICWKKPGPKAGPFQACLGDGSVVTYYWYRFADQPALLNADLTDAEREKLQARVELLHQNWTKDRDYLAPPAMGTLAEIDPALIVSPPAGLETGYVPIATKQAMGEKLPTR